jgi:NAD-dependent SIR2 family protein deacetylase
MGNMPLDFSDDSDVDDLTNQVQKLTVASTSNEQKGEEEIAIPEGIRKVADFILKGKKRILVLSGAGVSVAAGIPDFRSPGTGLYDNLQKYNLPYPEAVFDVNFYKKNPKPFCTLAKNIWPGVTHSPTLTHSFLALLSRKGVLLRNYSQNIDGLEFLAEIPADHLVECHGHFRSASCIGCDEEADGEEVKNTILQLGETPKCKHCGQHVKPDIVFFGEALPGRFHKLLKTDTDKADLLLVMGTSLQVAPVSSIPNLVNCTRVLFNRDLVMNLKKKDVFVEGDCDANVKLLCQLLGWEDELLEQNAKTRISSEQDEVKK